MAEQVDFMRRRAAAFSLREKVIWFVMPGFDYVAINMEPGSIIRVHEPQVRQWRGARA
jgi:hypothetical protein